MQASHSRYRQETEVMLSAAREAGKVALRYFSTATPVEEKEDHSPVTAADRECEALIHGLLTEAFPDDGILGEEGAAAQARSGRRWLIDPIDGTRDFVRRNSFWSVQIALEDRGKVVLGCIFFPCLDGMLWAVTEVGCFWNNTPVRASAVSQLDRAILMVSGLKAAWSVWQPGPLRQLTESCWTVRSYGASYDIAMLARGTADIWLSGSGMQWDYAAARVIAQEAGARFLTRDGSDRIDARHCLICTAGLEAELRRVLRIG